VELDDTFDPRSIDDEDQDENRRRSKHSFFSGFRSFPQHKRRSQRGAGGRGNAAAASEILPPPPPPTAETGQNDALNNTGIYSSSADVMQDDFEEGVRSPTLSSSAGSASSGRSDTHGEGPDEPDEGRSDGAAEHVPRSHKKRKSIPRRGEENLAQREWIANRNEVQALRAACPDPRIADFLMEMGLNYGGTGLDSWLFQSGPMIDFCNSIAECNQSERSRVKKSKMKLLKTWPNHREEFYSCNGALKPSNITLTPQGKHHLLLHVDLEQDGMSHNLESICRNQASDMITKLHDVSRKLPQYVDTAAKNRLVKETTHEASTQENRKQVQMVCKQNNCSKESALNKLRSATQHLYRGVFDKPAVQMVALATGKTKKQIYSKGGVLAHGNEPVLHVHRLQRSIVSVKMQKGMDWLQAHKEVGASGGIDMMKLCGLDPDDPNSERELAEVCFDRRRGYEIWGQQQLGGSNNLLEAPVGGQLLLPDA
jgi:hypothetical protein